ncbi:MAG: MBL fold metallo-hydrolase [Candidatus Omnitrophota bacterium]
MEIKILFDKDGLDDRFLTGWGISYLVDSNILFDTGEDPYRLFRNMEYMNVKAEDISAVIISHDHWDHTGGLEGILKTKRNMDIYTCPNFSDEFKHDVRGFGGNIIESEKIAEITRDIFVTGEILRSCDKGLIPEQALVIKTINGLTVLTGCAHPGILDILKKIKEGFPGERLYFVCGGFHLKDSSAEEIKSVIEGFKKIGVERVGPTHCSGEKTEAVFKEEYGKNFIPIKIGQVLEV